MSKEDNFTCLYQVVIPSLCLKCQSAQRGLMECHTYRPLPPLTKTKNKKCARVPWSAVCYENQRNTYVKTKSKSLHILGHLKNIYRYIIKLYLKFSEGGCSIFFKPKRILEWTNSKRHRTNGFSDPPSIRRKALGMGMRELEAIARGREQIGDF